MALYLGVSTFFYLFINTDKETKIMIETGYKRITKEKIRKAKTKLYSDPLFKMVYLPLWYQHEEDLTPVEVWQEANMVIGEMKAISKDIRHLEVSTIVEELNERYSSFDNVARTEEMAQHTTMLVLSTVMFMLAEADADWKHNPHLQLCRSISQIMSRVKGFKELCRDVKTEESRLTEENTSLPIRDFMGDTKESDIGDLPIFSDKDISACGIKHDNVTGILQAIWLVSKSFVASNDWIAVYAVLLDMEAITPTMTNFCTMVKNVFGVSIDSKYMNSVLRSHGKDIDKWNEIYDDQRRHLELVSALRQYISRLT